MENLKEEEKIEINLVPHEEVTPSSTDPKGLKKEHKESEVEVNFVSNDFQMKSDNIYKNLDVEDYKQYLGEDIYIPTGVIEALNLQRAENQPWTDQALNMVGQAVVGEIIGGTIEGLGYLLEVGNIIDYASGEEADFGNWLTDIGKGLREYTQENMAIYQTNPGTFNPGDPGFWFGNGVSVASTLSMLIPSTAATKALSFAGKGISKGLGVISKSLDIASKMGKQQKWMAKGISQAIVSRHIENSMEASGTFESARQDYMNTVDPETGTLFTEEKATKLASEAAASNYRAGWAMLLQDIPQYLAIGKVFNPKTMQMESALSKAASNGKKIGLKPWQQKVKAGVGTFASEGFEESYQYYIAERGKALTDLKAGLITEEEYNEQMSEAFGSDEMMTSAFFGGLGGNLFQAAGSGLNHILKGKKGREQDKLYAESYKNLLTERAKHFTAMQIELAKADESNNPEAREMVLDEMMTQMTIDAINGDKFDLHVETLNQMMELNNEDAQEFASKYGVELNKDLASKYVPKAIEKAHEIRKLYLKNLNKNNEFVATKMTYNQIQNKSLARSIENTRNNISERKKEIPFIEKFSAPFKQIMDMETKIKALEFSAKLNKHKAKKAPKRKKEFYQNLADQAVKDRMALMKELNEFENNDTRTKEELKVDNKNKKAYQNAIKELAQMESDIIEGENMIAFNEEENSLIQDPEYQKEIAKEQLFNSLKVINSEDTIDKKIEEINASEEYDNESKAEAVEALNKRRKKIISDKKKAEKKAKQAANEEALAKKIAENAKNEATLTNENNSQLEDNIEDEYSDEEPDFNEKVSEKDNKANDSKVYDKVRVLDDFIGAKGSNAGKVVKMSSPQWTEWIENGRPKVGQTMRVTLGDARNSVQAEALELYRKEVINEKVINFLPLKIQHPDNDSIFSFLPGFTKDNTNFQTNEYPARKSYIEAMLDSGNNIAETEVAVTYGGELQIDEVGPEEDIPKNNILDLDQINGDATKIELMFSNEMGTLLDENKKVPKDFRGYQFDLPGVTDDKGNNIPYKGGVFLNVKKADGHPFPLRLNVAKLNTDQAETVADLLIRVVLKREFAYGMPMSKLPKEIQDRLKELHPEELKVLGKDPKVNDIVDLFVYVSEKTKGRKTELYFKGNRLFFGQEHYALDPKTADSKEGRELLTNFLTTIKNRQVNLNRWRTSPKYRLYAMNSGLISTNATVNGPLFKSNHKDKPTKLYITRVKPKSKPQKVVNNNKNTASLKDIQSRAQKSQATLKQDGKQWKASHFASDGSEKKFVANTKEEVYSKVAELYDAETIGVVPSENPVPDNPSNKTTERSPKKKKNPFEMSAEDMEGLSNEDTKDLDDIFGKQETVEVKAPIPAKKQSEKITKVQDSRKKDLDNKAEIDRLNAKRKEEINSLKKSGILDQSEFDSVNAEYDAKIDALSQKEFVSSPKQTLNDIWGYKDDLTEDELEVGLNDLSDADSLNNESLNDIGMNENLPKKDNVNFSDEYEIDYDSIDDFEEDSEWSVDCFKRKK